MRQPMVVLAAVALASCGGQGGAGGLPRGLGTFTAELTPAVIPLSAAPAAGDERGGGIFVDLSGRVVRLRGDGTRGAVDAHPQSPVFPGPATRVWPLGPFSALAATDRGPFVVESGWIFSPGWQGLLDGAGLKGTAAGLDGTAWLGHDRGLFRLEGGQLAELTVAGASITGLTHLAVGPAPDGREAVWFARGDRLTSAARTSRTGVVVRESGLSSAELAGGVVALAGIGPSPGSAGELWVATGAALYQYTVLGWSRYELGARPRQLLAAGRFAWLQAGDGLYRYDADRQQWSEATGLAAVPALVTVDAAGAAWVRIGADTVQVSPGPVVRVRGLFEGQTVFEPDLPITASVPTAAGPRSLAVAVDGEAPRVQLASDALPGVGPLAQETVWSAAGYEPGGVVRRLSLAGLSDGRHTLSVSAGLADGGVSERRVNFELKVGESAVVSFQRDVAPLATARCGGSKCHATGTEPELVTFQQWKDNAQAIATATREKRMPADGPLTNAEIQLIQRWVSGGALP